MAFVALFVLFSERDLNRLVYASLSEGLVSLISVLLVGRAAERLLAHPTHCVAFHRGFADHAFSVT